MEVQAASLSCREAVGQRLLRSAVQEPPDVPDFAHGLFAIDVVILLILLAGTIRALTPPERRIDPPPVFEAP